MNIGTPRPGRPSMFGFDFAAKKKKNLTSPNRHSPSENRLHLQLALSRTAPKILGVSKKRKKTLPACELQVVGPKRHPVSPSASHIINRRTEHRLSFFSLFSLIQRKSTNTPNNNDNLLGIHYK